MFAKIGLDDLTAILWTDWTDLEIQSSAIEDFYIERDT